MSWDILLIIVGLAVAAGLLWKYGPQGWRTAIMHGVTIVVPFAAAAFEFLTQQDIAGVLNGNRSLAVIIGIGVVALLFNMGNSKLYRKD
jgi:hypothetical protein